MPDTPLNPEDAELAYHRPISGTLIDVGPIPEIREVPPQTELRFNLKMDLRGALKLIMEIIRQLMINPAFVGIEIKSKVG